MSPTEKFLGTLLAFAVVGMLGAIFYPYWERSPARQDIRCLASVTVAVAVAAATRRRRKRAPVATVIDITGRLSGDVPVQRDEASR